MLATNFKNSRKEKVHPWSFWPVRSGSNISVSNSKCFCNHTLRFHAIVGFNIQNYSKLFSAEFDFFLSIQSVNVTALPNFQLFCLARLSLFRVSSKIDSVVVGTTIFTWGLYHQKQANVCNPSIFGNDTSVVCKRNWWKLKCYFDAEDRYTHRSFISRNKTCTVSRYKKRDNGHPCPLFLFR